MTKFFSVGREQKRNQGFFKALGLVRRQRLAICHPNILIMGIQFSLPDVRCLWDLGARLCCVVVELKITECDFKKQWEFLTQGDAQEC